MKILWKAGAQHIPNDRHRSRGVAPTLAKGYGPNSGKRVAWNFAPKAAPKALIRKKSSATRASCVWATDVEVPRLIRDP